MSAINRPNSVTRQPGKTGAHPCGTDILPGQMACTSLQTSQVSTTGTEEMKPFYLPCGPRADGPAGSAGPGSSIGSRPVFVRVPRGQERCADAAARISTSSRALPVPLRPAMAELVDAEHRHRLRFVPQQRGRPWLECVGDDRRSLRGDTEAGEPPSVANSSVTKSRVRIRHDRFSAVDVDHVHRRKPAHRSLVDRLQSDWLRKTRRPISA